MSRYTRSLLFVPANRPERFLKAMGTGADRVCIDLEDAVAPADKASARDTLVRELAQLRPETGVSIGVRINALDGAEWERDIEAIGANAQFIMVPKVNSAEQLAAVAAKLGADAELWPLIETPAGVRESWNIAAVPVVRGILFGAFDYAAELGCDLAWEPLLFARSQLAAACAMARRELLDAPNGDLHDQDGLAESSRRVKALGYTGRACIHPGQVSVVNGVFGVSPEELERARRVVAAFEAGHGAAAQLDGKLIELPVALAARRVLGRVGGIS